MTLPTLPLVHSHHPTTFLERGVTVPFTSPMLSGARARPSDRGGIELIVPNPSGGRGVYILPWSGICQLCHPTVHDTKLYQAITERHGITPASIRQAAGVVAVQELAGRGAAAAARVALDNDLRDRLAANFQLLLATIRQSAPPGTMPDMAGAVAAVDMERHAKHGIEQIAPRLGHSSQVVFNTVEQLADVLTPIGLDAQGPPARVPRLLSAITRFYHEAGQWAREHDDCSGSQARLAGQIAEVTITCAELTLADARASADDVAALLSEWIVAPDALARRLTRCEWLVDGWEQICLLWQTATTRAARHVALAEIALLVPILPKEVASWLGRRVELDDTRNIPRIVPGDTDWRTGLHYERVARNEVLRALAA
jgi:hypothetical protein